MNKILIIQTASIGDVVLATPLMENLHKSYPEADLDLVLKKGNETLFFAHPYLRKIYTWDKSSKKLRHWYHILKEVQPERYDLVINVQRFFLTGALAALSRARQRIGFSKNPMSVFYTRRVKHNIGEGCHETTRNLALISHIVDRPDPKPVLYPSPQDDAFTSQYKTHRYVCIAPASLWGTKQFPAEKWIEFLQKLPQDLYVYFLGSSADHALCEDILRASGHSNSINLAGKMSLLESASLQRDAAMNFVNDSAPMHLASAVNAPVTAVFCSTVTAFGFGPLSGNAAVVETPKKLTCRPCGLHGHDKCPEKHFDCAMTIEVNDLLRRIL